MICYKPDNKHIIPDTFSRHASTNINSLSSDPNYEELDALFTYNTTLIKVNLELF